MTSEGLCSERMKYESTSDQMWVEKAREVTFSPTTITQLWWPH